MRPPRSTTIGTDVDPAVFDGQVVQAQVWPAIDVAGRRVGLLASGPDAVRMLPEIVRRAPLVKVFQRRADVVLPVLPLVRTARRSTLVARGLARAHLRLAVGDSEMRRKLAPRGDGHVAFSNRWYRSLQQPNCQLITWPIARITPTGIQTADGVVHVVDILVVA